MLTERVVKGLASLDRVDPAIGKRGATLTDPDPAGAAGIDKGLGEKCQISVQAVGMRTATT